MSGMDEPVTEITINSGEVEESDSEEVEEYLVVEFEGALDKNVLRDYPKLIITDLLDKPMMSVGPMTFEGHYEKIPGTALFFESVPTAPATNEEQSSVKLTTELIACCHRKIEMKRVLLERKDGRDVVATKSTEVHDVTMDANDETAPQNDTG